MTRITHVDINGLRIGEDQPLVLIAGPCVIESLDHCLGVAEAAAQICRRLDVGYIFKASYDKANRSSGGSFRGPGLDAGLKILAEVKRQTGLLVLSDIHEAHHAAPAGGVLDVLQIPAFLSRQTDLLEAAGRTGKAVNVKKGQYMAPEEMTNVVAKIRGVGNDAVMLTERGTFFGYHHLVNDMTAIPKMRRLAPVVFDATHSCQLPGGAITQSGGQREYAGDLARAAVAAGADALFLEIHDDPANAKSDAASVLPLDELEPLLQRCVAIAQACGRPASPPAD
jgi:2-dehydro-3-deoxyphosphooctonate aldolase (KDO 8-P synthase)